MIAKCKRCKATTRIHAKEVCMSCYQHIRRHKKKCKSCLFHGYKP